MSADTNAATARRVLDEAFNEGRIDVLDEILSQDMVSHDPAEPEDVRGIDAHKERVRKYRGAMPDLHITLEDIFASGDEVCSRWTVRGTNDGALEGMPPTGRKIEIAGMTIDRFDEDGRIVEAWDNWDNAGFMQQLGITPEMAGQAS